MNAEIIAQAKNQVTEAENSARLIAGSLDETSNLALLLLNRMIGESEDMLHQVEGDQRLKLMNLIESFSTIKSSVVQLKNLDFSLVMHRLGQLHEDLSRINISGIE